MNLYFVSKQIAISITNMFKYPSHESKTTIRGGYSPLLHIAQQCSNVSISSFERTCMPPSSNLA
uniref:Uncharacterized protein n=1 Tax=Rhizophora mucronata TaxID=61149 RepID=A0A2P2Q8L2_RHIMU